MSHHNVFTAFMAPIPIASTGLASRHVACSRQRPMMPVFRSQARRATSVYMMAESSGNSEQDKKPEQAFEGDSDEEDNGTSATEILKTLREDSAADMASRDPEDDRASRSMLGVYRDVDGRSNVWAVEPQEETDTRPQISKTIIVLASLAFIIGILLVLPILPFSNPDQV